MDIESKIKNVRFIAELTKFKVFPFAKSFKVLSACVADFRQHSLEQLSHLLDACGRRRQRVADVIGFLIADLLPSDYRGVYRETSDELREARAIAQALSS